MRVTKISRWSLVLALAVSLGSPLSAADKEGSFWDKTRVSGSADINYNYNINRPTTTAAVTAANGYRVFDVNPNTFNIGLVELALENSPTDWVTLRTDLDFGRDATLFHAAGFGAATDIFDLQQAHVILKANRIGNGLNFKVGKFVTLHGMEVIEAAANYNISRGLLFGYAIPFTHTGVVASYPFSDRVSLDFGVVNGWA
ncbi:MAG: outer membrane beta-barrel protein [Deltaproteobacteria bacterium]|nr:outer membrane beta-barrel protein [Deltaproteobacteria bacterium]